MVNKTRKWPGCTEFVASTLNVTVTGFANFKKFSLSFAKLLILNKSFKIPFMEFFDTFITKTKMTKIVITQFLYAGILLHQTLVQKNIAETLNIASHLCQYHFLLIDHPIDSCQNPFSRKIIIWLESEIGLLSDPG